MKLDKGNMVLLKFELHTALGVKEFQPIARIVHSAQLPNRGKVYEHRLEFAYLLKEDREAIVRYIFDEERKRRRKEKGLI